MNVPFMSRPDPEPDAARPSLTPQVPTASAAPATASDRLVLRPAGHDDLHLTARVHVDLLPIGLFPALGTHFVRRWHRTFVDSPHGAIYVVIDPQAPGNGFVGFLLGTTDQAAYTAAVLADPRAMAGLALRGSTALLRRPRLGWHFTRSRALPWARRLFHPRSAVPAAAPGLKARPGVTPEPVAVLCAVAVRPDRRGSGVGGRLVAHFLRQARLSGATTAELVTAVGALGAARFYERSGWQAGPERQTRDGDLVRTYQRTLHDSDAR
jgi:GNAT superfamily N-acetyltransferase